MDSLFKSENFKKVLIFWSFICASLVLLFTTRSSALFVCNNWDDANSYFTMGKGMMNGLVIYRDMYDQKGPFLYLLYGLAYLISEKSFFGVFIFEIIAGTAFLYFTGKLIERKSSSRMALLLLPVVSAAVYSSWSFYFGGAAEEFCLPLLAYSVLKLDELLTDKPDKKVVFNIFARVGICAGIIAQVKYTMLGFFFAWFVLAVIGLCADKDIKTAVTAGVRFVLFACIPSVPWFIYFLATGSLDDWFRCYIYNNLFFYSQVSTEEYSFFHKLYEMAKTLYWLIQDSWSYFVLIITGFALQLVMEKGIIKRISSVFIFGLTYFVIFIGGNKLAYYSIPLMVLAIPGAAYIGRGIKALLERFKMSVNSLVCSGVAILLLACGVVFSAGNTVNAEYRGFKKEDVWLVEAAGMLDKDDTLLELNTIDPGLYTLTGIVPTCEYFQTNGIGLPIMFEEQKKYLKEARTEYVLAVEFEPEGIYENYSLIKTFDYNETGYETQYYLYKRN